MPEDLRVQVAPDVELRVLVWPAGGDASAPEHDRGRAPRPPAFLLVHGLASNAWLWNGVARRLSLAGHRVVAIDQRGHGASHDVGHGLDHATLVGDLLAVVDAFDLDRPVVAGQSWGGNVVLDLAHTAPDRVAGAVLVDGGFIQLADAFPDWEDAERQLAPPRLEGTPLTDIEQRMRAGHPGWSDEAIEAQLANFAVRPDGTVTPNLTRDRHLTILRQLWEHRPSALFPEVTVPVLLVPVGDDHAPSAWAERKRDQVAAADTALARSEVVWFDGHDHDVHAEDPVAVAEAMLARVASGFFDVTEGGA